ncbi:unnamed protein product [Peniophora sp. CBMAI 1063]|nr:unnamed protein product [Peniophora sp. CBMAI 1063]
MVSSPSQTLVGLPDDVLCEMYNVLAEIDPPRAAGRNVRRDMNHNTLGWIKLTHVNRRLRGLGLNLATLWGRVLCLLPRGCEEILERSQNAALVLHLGPVSYTTPGDFFEMLPIFDILPRAYSITDQLSNEHPLPRREWWLSSSLDNLRHLDLNAMSLPMHTLEDRGRIVAPALCTYRAAFVFVPFTAPLLRNLHLSYTALTWIQLLDIFCACPLLAAIHVIGLRNAAPSTRPTVVSLPHLQHLAMSTQGHQDILNLMDHLRFPESANCSFDMWDEDSDNMSNFIRSCLTRRQLEYSPRNALSITTWRDPAAVPEESGLESGFRISLTEACNEASSRYGTAPTDGGLRLETILDTSNELQLVNALTHLSPGALRSIDTVAFYAGIVLDPPYDNWHDPLATSVDAFASVWRAARALLRVETVYFSDIGQRSMSLLMPHPEWTESTEGSTPDACIAFPALRSIVVSSKYRAPSEVWSVLLEVVERRREIGRPVKHVVLVGNGPCHTVGNQADVETSHHDDRGRDDWKAIVKEDRSWDALQSGDVEVFDLRAKVCRCRTCSLSQS